MKDIDVKKNLEQWKDSNEKNNYQKMIATRGFLHDNSKELVKQLQENNITFNNFFEVGCGMARNIYYIKKAYSDSNFFGNDLSKKECYKYMDDYVKDMTFFETDTLSLMNLELKTIPDAVLDSDHLMHLPPDSVDLILLTIAKKWKPKYFLTRRPIIEREKMPTVWLHDYSVFEEDYGLQSFMCQGDKNYKIDIYTRKELI